MSATGGANAAGAGNTAGPDRAAGAAGGGHPAGEATRFDASYAATPPWDIDEAQPAFLALAQSGQIRGRVLDIGCGTGEHALMAADFGLAAVGIDAAPTAIAKAEVKAHDRGLRVQFVVGNALDLTSFTDPLGQFDTVLDCGVYHVFDDDERPRYVQSLAELIRTGGRYFMLCFNEHQSGDWGPRRITQAEIRASFSHGWRVDSIERSRLVVTFQPDGVDAWLAAVTRT
ncbi:MAG: hypothetical protein QOF30_1065 [Acidimicrobiaceae bacterium]|jgi:SAM-dependent methyltransferase|nr:hypothetical protein [Acidimicrobiaceae bacterium]